MLDLPIPVKVLKYLRDNLGRGLTKPDIISGIGVDQEYVDRALKKLVEKEIVVEEMGSYVYRATSQAEEFSDKLFRLYEKLSQRPFKELLIRGAIASRAPLHAEALLKALEEEGFTREELASFIEGEIQNGYVRKIRTLYLEVQPFLIPFFRYHPRFRLVEPGEFNRIKEDYKRAGLELREEVYLTANYPPELARPAKEYLNRERPEIKERIFEQEMPVRFPEFL